MYINIKSKYKKILWFILGFTLACCFIHKVNAQTVTIENSNISDIDFTFNGITYDYQKIKSDIDTHLSSCGYILDDFNGYLLTMPSSPTTSTSGYDVYRNFFRIALFNNVTITGYDFKNQNYDGSYFTYSGSDSGVIITWNMRTKTVSHNCSATGLFNTNVHRGVSSSNYFNYYSNVNWNNTINLNANETYQVYSKLLIDNSLFYSLPDYLNGYRKITLTTSDRYYMLSGLSTGSVFIPIDDFNSSGGRLSYYDNELSSQPYTSYIQDYTITSDGLYARQDFDLSSYYGADFVMFSKYIYLDTEDNITYDIWVPEDITYSDVIITPNSSGGNDFEFQYKDSNGDIQNQTTTSVDLTPPQPLLSDVFNNFTTNYYGLSSIILSPISFLEGVNNASCTPLSIPLPYSSNSLILPCMTPLYQSWFGNLFTLYQTITAGFIAYYVGLGYFNLIKGLKDPSDDRIEVIHL